MNIAIINGPNLNLLGTREPGVYGSQTFDAFYHDLRQQFPGVTFSYFQSNVEGELVTAIQDAANSSAGIILNPAAYTHTSVAIGDAIGAIGVPVIEVHISNVHAREDFRKISHVSAKCKGTISGLGLTGYSLAARWLVDNVV